MAKFVLLLKIEGKLGDERTMANVLPRRRNQLDRTTESWRPPLFTPVRTRYDRWFAAARRFVDLQAGSVWNDLSQLLPERRGFVLDAGCGAQPYRSLVNPEATYQGIDQADASAAYRLLHARYDLLRRGSLASLGCISGCGCNHRNAGARSRSPCLPVPGFSLLEARRNLDSHGPVRGPLALYSQRLLAIHTIRTASGCSRPRDSPALKSSLVAMS